MQWVKNEHKIMQEQCVRNQSNQKIILPHMLHILVVPLLVIAVTFGIKLLSGQKQRSLSFSKVFLMFLL